MLRHMRWLALPVCLALVAAAFGACRARSPARAPVAIPPPPAPSGAAHARPAAPDAGPAPPTQAQCVQLWHRYHGQVPVDPATDAASFVARCRRSDPETLDCIEHAQHEAEEALKRAGAPQDGGAAVKMQLARLVRMFLPSRVGICMTRQRLRFALGAGELDALARDIAAGRLHPDKTGLLVLRGTRSTLPWRGYVELENPPSVEPGAPGEVRVKRQPDGSVWIYFLGSLLGRHQNQVGFVFASKPFGNLDKDENGDASTCFPIPAYDANARSRRAMLPCFAVAEKVAPRLLEVGAAPD